MAAKTLPESAHEMPSAPRSKGPGNISMIVQRPCLDPRAVRRRAARYAAPLSGRLPLPSLPRRQLPLLLRTGERRSAQATGAGSSRPRLCWATSKNCGRPGSAIEPSGPQVSPNQRWR
jgi:hypothetical protein